MNHTDNECIGCKIIKEGKGPAGGPVIHLEGSWTLNQYGGEEGFLGWLILQPAEHKGDITALTKEELRSLGENLKEIEKALKDYWFCNWQDDPIERLYVVSFSEYSHGHLHFHLIPRTTKMVDLLKYKCSIRAWDIYMIRHRAKFPQHYIVYPGQHNRNVEKLMDYLKKNLPNQVK
jgi:diadenosine tetraphosphate (Ap4A) HIT family hydrolase